MEQTRVPVLDRHLIRRRRDGKRWEPVLRAPSPADRDAAIVELLRNAKELIKDPKDSTRGTYRSLRGRYRAVGALRAASKRLKDPNPAWAAHDLLIRVARAHRFTSVEAMNDRSSHDAVLAAFDEATVLVDGVALVRDGAA